MTTYSPTASAPSPRAAPSPRFGHLHTHLRTYVAGVGATAALTAGALVAFLSLATFVAFNGLPFGGSSDDAGSAYLESSLSAAPTAAAAALGAAAAQWPTIRLPAPRRGCQRKDRGAGAAAPVPAALTLPARPRRSAVQATRAPAPHPGTSPSPPIAVPSLPSTSGPVTNAVQGVDTAAGTNLSGPTRGVTRAVDGVGTGALNQAGGAAGRPGLGTQAGSAVGGIAGGALGG